MLVSLGDATVLIDANRNVRFSGPSRVTLGPAFLGNTGLIATLTNFNFALRSGWPRGYDRTGNSGAAAEFPLPDNTAITLANMRITRRGLTGGVALELPLELVDRNYIYRPNTTATVFGIPGGLRHVALAFEQNQMTGCDITGSLIVPYSMSQSRFASRLIRVANSISLYLGQAQTKLL